MMAMLWLLLLFQIKHCIADFFLQSGQSVGAKHIYLNRSNLIHAGHHGWLSGVAVFIVTQQVMVAIAVAIADFVIHLHIDWAKASLVCKSKWTMADSQFWWAFGIDQFLHQLTYLSFVAVLMA